MTDIRTGCGYDIHALVPGRGLFLCGCKIPYEKGLLGHSDADAPVHAVIDAILGALALGDIGQHFPDTDPAYEGISGKALAEKLMALPELHGWHIGNADINIIAQAPKLAPYVQAMRTSLADMFHTDVSRISVKAKTAEKMGPVGEKLAIEAYASVLMIRD